MKYLIIFLGVVCLSFTLLPSCAPQPEQQAEPVAEEAPSTEADVEAIKAAIEEWEVAWNSQDMEKLLSLYADDAVRMPPNEVEEVGKNAIRASFQQSFDEMTAEGGGEAVDVRVAGDLAYARGPWVATSTPKTGGEPIQDNSKWVEVLQRQADGSWKIICEMWNSNNPPPEEPTT
jgi:uncharacterized protein (TIGR02246 family)